jgi:hypothetical protein
MIQRPTNPLEYLELNRSEIISQLTQELDNSEEKACQVFDFMTDMIKGLKPLRANKSTTDAYIEETLKNFPLLC